MTYIQETEAKLLAQELAAGSWRSSVACFSPALLCAWAGRCTWPGVLVLVLGPPAWLCEHEWQWELSLARRMFSAGPGLHQPGHQGAEVALTACFQSSKTAWVTSQGGCNCGHVHAAGCANASVHVLGLKFPPTDGFGGGLLLFFGQAERGIFPSCFFYNYGVFSYCIKGD